MNTARPLGPTARALLRLLAGWLAVLLLVQGLAAGQALASRHQHRPMDAAMSPAALAHAGLHQAALPHAHDLLDTSVVPLDGDAADAAHGQSLLAAFAAALPSAAVLLLEPRGHLLQAAAPWTASQQASAPPRRPPRQA